MATATHTENDGRDWYEITGLDYGTQYMFDAGTVYGVTEDGSILDEDGYPLTDGDIETIAVQNTIDT